MYTSTASTVNAVVAKKQAELNMLDAPLRDFRHRLPLSLYISRTQEKTEQGVFQTAPSKLGG